MRQNFIAPRGQPSVPVGDSSEDFDFEASERYRVQHPALLANVSFGETAQQPHGGVQIN